MSEDPIIAIRQVVESIDEGCVPGSGHVTSGWLRRASKDEILDWVCGNLRGRVINALKRTEEAFADLHVDASKVQNLRDSLQQFVDWYEEKLDDLDGIAEHAGKVLRETDLVECEIVRENVDLRLQLEKKRNCDRFNSGDPEKDADDALHAYLDEGVAGFRAVARYLLSPIKEKPCTHATDATI